MFLCAFALSAQQHKLSIDIETDEGKLLHRLEEQENPLQKRQIMEEFVAKYPKHAGVPWVYGQLQPIYLKDGQFDRVLEAGEKALAVDPDNPDLAYNNLKAAEGKKDPELVKTWSARTSQSARKIIDAGKQATDTDKKTLDYARQLDIYTEYSVYALALQVTDPAQTIDLTENLEQRNPKSQYLPKLSGKYLNALRQAGQGEKAGVRAEQLAAIDPNNEDALLIAADWYLQKKNQPEKVIAYSTKLLKLLQDKPKPEGLSDQDWKRKRDSFLGLGYWMPGVTYSAQGQFKDADQWLRLALPYLADDQLRAMGLFHLGLANYQLGKAAKNKARMQEGLKYSEESAALASPLQVQALKNVQVIRAELGMK